MKFGLDEIWVGVWQGEEFMNKFALFFLFWGWGAGRCPFGSIIERWVHEHQSAKLFQLKMKQLHMINMYMYTQMRSITSTILLADNFDSLKFHDMNFRLISHY